MNDRMTSVVRVGMFRSPARFRNFSMDRYAESLAAALRERCGDFASIEEVRPSGGEAPGRSQRIPVASRLSDYAVRYPGYLTQARSARFAVNHIVDHAYGHLAYVLDPKRTVVTCHDIFPLLQWKGAIRGLSPRITPPLSVLASLSGMCRARAVLTSTQATKDDIVARLGIDPGKIRVVPYGLDTAFRQLTPNEQAEAVADYPLGGGGARYILAIDTGAAYKNQRATIEVLARARARAEADIRLVRIGPPLRADEMRRARSFGVAGAIIELGQPSDSEVVAIYSRADVLLFPSFYEGFGWPPLEAMACGVPVVASRARAVAEVVGDAALLADAEDYDGLTAHVLAVLSDRTMAVHLVRRGSRRAQAFTWDRAARDVADVYRTILAGESRASGGGGYGPIARAGDRAEEADTQCAA